MACWMVRSRTARPLTKMYWCLLVPRAMAGVPARPQRATPRLSSYWSAWTSRSWVASSLPRMAMARSRGDWLGGRSRVWRPSTGAAEGAAGGGGGGGVAAAGGWVGGGVGGLAAVDRRGEGDGGVGQGELLEDVEGALLLGADCAEELAAG